IGGSTAAAIAAFCFGERVAILDGNVKRVLTRVLAFGGDLAEGANERRLWDEATALLPHEGIETYTQGLMDLGATLCLARSPQCLICPVRELCAARREGTPERFPLKTRRLKRKARESVWLWLRWGEKHWLVQRPEQGVWAGLWSLPEFDSIDALGASSMSWPGEGEALPSFTHVLTHLDWTLHPRRARLARKPAEGAALAQGRWVARDDLAAIALPAPLRKLLLADSRAGDPT
ncbi:MAG TPA: NUDIX domain-containing protein, partial [Burkholderiaceae bacterium]|nr:NUDIX domain-containing protein [Burkholderiaceae bacterium]